MTKNIECVDCNKIKCTNCGWEPNEKQLSDVILGKITICPDCGKSK